MLIFATSAKDGAGRSVTSANICYRRALQGSDVAYLDFDFGSPTAGAIFAIPSMQWEKDRLHAYLQGRTEAGSLRCRVVADQSVDQVVGAAV